MSAIALIKTAAVSSARMATVQKAAPTLSWAIMSRRAYATDNNGENTTEAPKQPASEEATEKKTEAGKSAEELTAALAEKEKKLAEIQVCTYNKVMAGKACWARMLSNGHVSQMG
jgi:hypothetical protein